MTKTETKPEINLPPAPPIVELAWLEAEDHPLDHMTVWDAPPDYGPNYHASAYYVLIGRDKKHDGTEWVTLDYGGRGNRDDDANPFLAPAPLPPPFAVPASRVRRTFRATPYGSPINPWGHDPSFIFSPAWERDLRLLFGDEFADAELARIEGLGETREQRLTAWLSERDAFIEAGAIPSE